MSEWQPIETAPRDCSLLLLYSAKWAGCGVFRWSVDDDFWVSKERTDAWDEMASFGPTHWMLLPKPAVNT